MTTDPDPDLFWIINRLHLDLARTQSEIKLLVSENKMLRWRVRDLEDRLAGANAELIMERQRVEIAY